MFNIRLWEELLDWRLKLPEAIGNWKDLIRNDHVTEASQSLRDTADTVLKISQTLREESDNIK